MPVYLGVVEDRLAVFEFKIPVTVDLIYDVSDRRLFGLSYVFGIGPRIRCITFFIQALGKLKRLLRLISEPLGHRGLKGCLREKFRRLLGDFFLLNV